jgi:hypothetical protein
VCKRTGTEEIPGTNHTGIFNPSSGGLLGKNVVGSGANLPAPVPEPSALLLLLLAGLLARRR